MFSGCTLKYLRNCLFAILLIGPATFFLGIKPGEVIADESTPEIYGVEAVVQEILTANLDLKVAELETKAATAAREAARGAFFPTVNTTYQYKRHYEERRSPFGVSVPQNEFSFVATLSQPIFAGFAIKNQFDITTLALEASRLGHEQVRQAITLQAKQAFFQLLKTRKLLTVAEQTTAQLEAHKEVAQSFYDVGMTPLNDLLQAQVELANARQGEINARNNAEIAQSDLNNLLRRPLYTPAEVQDDAEFEPLPWSLEYCQAEAFKRRPEIEIARLDMEIADKTVGLARRNFYPTVSLQGNYYQMGTEWDVNGGRGIADPTFWDVRAVATWDIWESGQSFHGVKEGLSRLKQSRLNQEKIKDEIRLEVKTAYLRTLEAQENIGTVEQAIEQADENYRINQERYKEQIATATDVLDAQTLLSRTMTNYYNALYDFKISKAALQRAMGLGLGPEK